MNNASDVEAARFEIVATVRRMLNGTLSFVEGARQITAFLDAARLDYCDHTVAPFVAIDSETDTLPFGDVRGLWAPAALERLQPEIDRAEQWARTTGLVYCEDLIKRLALVEEPPIEDEADYWLRLGRRISMQMRMSGDNNLRFLWVDGAVPNSVLPKLDEAVVVVWMFVSENSGKSFEEYKMTAYLDPYGIECYLTGDWKKLLPDPEARGWLTVRREAKEMDVRLQAAS